MPQLDAQSLWAKYHQRLRRFLLSRVNNEADAEDLLQEILIKVHSNLPDLKQQGSAKAWLFQIANRTIIDFYRSGRARELPEDEMLWHERPVEDLKRDLERCIEPFFANLPEAMSELLVAVDLNGEPQIQVAERLGLSYSTLKSRVQKARAMLRREFELCCSFSVNSSGNLVDYDPRSSQCRDC